MKQYLPAPIRVLGSALVDWWDALMPLMLINVVAGICMFLIIPGPPAIFGIYYAANEIAHGRSVEFTEFLGAMRRYALKSWLWAIPSVLFTVAAGVSFVFYGQSGTPLGVILQWLVVFVSLGWITVQFYTLAYFAELREKRLMQAWKNGLFTMLASPVYSLMIMFFAALIFALCAVFVAPMFLGGLCLLALFGTRAILERLVTLGVRAREAAEGIGPEV